ncbi:MAG: KTSC domain-containing protein [Phycisphaerae bacterium]|jgi:hypothetical protein
MFTDDVKTINYSESSNTLTVTYQGGTTCHYRPVNPENYAEIVKADCLSKVLHGVLRRSGIVGITSSRGN